MLRVTVYIKIFLIIPKKKEKIVKNRVNNETSAVDIAEAENYWIKFIEHQQFYKKYYYWRKV